ncbi:MULTISPECIES: hypothetical protein [Cellulophaga]|uniref:Uncharacterized protein n=1 Tax=Cellulophaga fucicola TaxID=76595 RepID=A0A1K1PRK0_9FLAO|nr:MULTISPECIES: hypothetical protein [Cellulophaga]SFW50069.1 hypothetical protein SAMN05660313_02144 [Cellulophaga fucicola]
MKNIELKMKIENDIYSLISSTCSQRINSKANELHKAIVKKHYNATDVRIDYFRKRLVMDLVIDDSTYNPNTINTFIPTFKANFYYLDLQDFLKSCIAKDDRSIAFYASLLRSLNFLDEHHKLLKSA